LSRNYRDFEFLHLLVLETGGHHPGILMVRLENDARRDLKPRAIAKAIANVETAKVPLTDQYIVLNHWR
jgi:hypothetical protein